ncbi:MAG: TatA/E family protein of Tat protein translocase [Bacteriovoracaceae bacterium]|jgi:sec-independent protein translocase protein TatA
MFGLGVGEVLVVLVIALIFIGPKKLPELAKGLGKGFREFQNAMRGINHTFQNPLDPNTQDNTKDRVPYDQQFQDDPPHEQNLPSDEAVASVDTEESPEKDLKPKEKITQGDDQK